MRYVASYLLAALGGNASPSAKDIKKILDSVGIEADDDRLNKVASRPPSPAEAHSAQRVPGPSVFFWGGKCGLEALIQPQENKTGMV